MTCVPNVLRGAAALTLFLAAPAFAGGNQLFLLQQSPPGATEGNVLTVDQTQATDSRGGGVEGSFAQTDELTVYDARALFDPDAPVPLTQRGERNEATVLMSGVGGIALLTQQGVDGGFGSDNRGLIEVFGNDSVGILAQFGSNNEGIVRIGADGAPVNNSAGTVIQRGNDNDLELQVQSNDTSVVYEQIGNGMTSTEAVQVFNSGSGGVITITQTQF